MCDMVRELLVALTTLHIGGLELYPIVIRVLVEACQESFLK